MYVLRNIADLASRSADRLQPVHSACRKLNHRRLLILNYHGVVADEYAHNHALFPNVIGVSEFSRQMALVSRLFHPIRPSELRNWQAGTATIPGKAVLVTFDDGYRNNLTRAAPVLDTFSIPALITVCPGYVGQDRLLWPEEIHRIVLNWPDRVLPMPLSPRGRWVPNDSLDRLTLANHLRESCKRLPTKQLKSYLAELRTYPAPKPIEEIDAFLSWDEIRTLNARGFEIGSHTLEHPILTQIEPEMVASELQESKRIIERHTGRECRFFAYPNGGPADISRDVVNEVHRAGYEFAFTVTGRLPCRDTNPLLLDRVYIGAGLSAAGFDSRIGGFHTTLKQWLNLSRIQGERSV
jgi:peptidoglycan/xylan/chitin deacetylase (PgdA/CDA1 family)